MRHTCALLHRHQAHVFLLVFGFMALPVASQTGDVAHKYPSVEVAAPGLEFRQFRGVEITGSSIIRKEQIQALPVQVITRQDIQRQGTTTLAQAISRLPNAMNGSEQGAIGNDFKGFTNGALHGMPTGTLVLLNGKRLAPFAIQSISGTERASVDLSMVPLSAVERIEVLTDGASSLYGTDAIAGVINIITRTEFSGVEMSVSHSRPAGGAAQGHVASLVWGKGQLAQDGFSLRLAAEWDHTRALKGTDRPNATQGRVGFLKGGVRYEADSSEVSGFTSPALLYSPGSAPPMLSGLFKEGACTGNSVIYRSYAGGCKANPLPSYDIYPESQSQKVHASGEVLLPNGATLYSELYYAQQKTQMGVSLWPRMSGRIVNEAGSPGYAEMLSAGLNPANGQYFWRADLPALQERFDKTLSRVTVGLKGELQGWSYHASLYQSLSRAQYDYDHPDLNGSLGLQTNKPLTNPNLLKPLDATNPLTAQLEALRNSWQPYVLGKTGLTALELRASRPWFEINGKDAMLGWGLDARQETVSSNKLMDTLLPDFSKKRNDVAAYAELQMPLRPDWDVIASWRTDRYSDVGSTTNAKLASRWAIDPKWALRGSAGTGFRAPSVGQTITVANPYLNQTLSNFSCTNDLNTVAAALAAQTGKDVRCRAGDVFNLFTNGNPELQPEKSLQATLGLAFTPHRNLTLTADYWRVQMRDTLQFMSYTSVLADPFKYQNQFVVDPAKILYPPTNTYFNRMGMLLQMQNLGQSLKEGIDLEAHYRHPGDWGRWHWGMKATAMLQSKTKSTPDAAWSSDLAAYAAATDTVVPRWRSQWTWGLEQANAYWQMTVNYSSGYTDKNVDLAFNTVTQKLETVSGLQVPGFLTADAMGTYQLNASTQIRVGVNNLFNRQPPMSFYSTSSFVWGVNSQTGSLFGRTAQVGMTVKF